MLTGLSSHHHTCSSIINYLLSQFDAVGYEGQNTAISITQGAQELLMTHLALTGIILNQMWVKSNRVKTNTGIFMIHDFHDFYS